MWLSEVEADRLRNLKAVRMEMPAGLTVLAGRNAQGKSSLLEAIYLLSTGRSFRTRRNDDLIAWDGGPLRVAGVVANRVGRTKLTVVMDGNARGLLVDGAEHGLDTFLGRLDTVDLTGERMKVLRGGPDERRRFLDRGIVGLDPSFLHVIGEYRRVLLQRNALLRRPRVGGSAGHAELDVWDEHLVNAARELHQRRRQYAVTLSSAMGEAGRVLFTKGEELTLRYAPSPSQAAERDPADFHECLREALAKSRDRDVALGHTFRGPHRDDLVVELDGVDLRRFGSAGQVRASMVALKLGKLSLLQNDRGETPLFLMDDFDTDIDEKRAADLAGYLDEAGFQAVVATSKEAMIDRLGVPFARFKVENGVTEPA